MQPKPPHGAGFLQTWAISSPPPTALRAQYSSALFADGQTEVLHSESPLTNVPASGTFKI